MMSERLKRAYKEVKSGWSVLSGANIELLQALEEQFPELLPKPEPKFRVHQLVAFESTTGAYYRKVKRLDWWDSSRGWRYDIGYGHQVDWEPESSLREVQWSEVRGKTELDIKESERE